jgi:N utilization substance protein A
MSEISSAIKQLCDEKNLDYKSVIAAVELALAAAYRKDYGERNQNIRVKFDPATGKSQIFDAKTVVDNLPEQEEAEMLRNLYNPNPKEDIREEYRPETINAEEAGEDGKKKFNPKTDIQIKEAQILKHDAEVGEEVITDLPIPESYGRMAAQTAKQVIIQKLREMERDMIFGEFKGKEHEVVSGIVQRREGRFVFVDLGKAIGVLPSEEQIYGERYNPNDRLKVFIKEVREGHKGPEIVLSRRSEEILRKVFYLEIPEIANGLVEIKAVAREAGARSKVAIYTEADNVDPVGSCVGQRGSRVQTIINELGGEKIDIIEYSENQEKFIANALAPAKVVSISLDNAEHRAVVKVASDKLSLAIGKAGQNVRLAAHLTGWKIDIVEMSEEGEKKVLGVEEDKVVVADEAVAEDLGLTTETTAAEELTEVIANEAQAVVEGAAVEEPVSSTEAKKVKKAPKTKKK